MTTPARPATPAFDFRTTFWNSITEDFPIDAVFYNACAAAVRKDMPLHKMLAVMAEAAHDWYDR